MTDPRAWLDAVDARTNAATDGPWTYGGQGWVFAPAPIPAHSGDTFDDLLATVTDDETGVFIASARTDLPAATTALRAVLDLADMWDSRADHDLEALKAFPTEVQDALYGQAWDMKHKATYIRAAITTALSQEDA